MPTGFLATTGGTTGGAAALSALAHAALLVAAVVGLHGRDAASAGAPADLDAIAIEAPELPAEAPKMPEAIDDPPERVTRTARSHDVRLDARAAGVSTSQASTAAPALTAADAPSAHFAMTVNAIEPAGATVSAPTTPRHADAPPRSRGAAKARVTYFVEPKYTAEALAAGIEGDVGLEIDVSEAGAFISARVTHGLGYGLDAAALAAVARWRFEPYRDADGRATAVRMPWPVRFRLQ